MENRILLWYNISRGWCLIVLFIAAQNCLINISERERYRLQQNEETKKSDEKIRMRTQHMTHNPSTINGDLVVEAQHFSAPVVGS